jgi:glycosyltransferase involved in cell wall biosynthesis
VRILYVCSDYGVPVYGHKGASVHLRALARALADLGHPVCVLAPSAERVGNPEFDLPVRTLEQGADLPLHLDALRQVDRRLGRMPSGHAARLTQEVRTLLYNEAVAGAAEAVADLQPDLVYERYALFGYGGRELARRLGVPHLLEVNAPLVDEQASARGLHLHDIALAIERRLWSESDALLVVSARLREHALAAGAAPARIQVLPNAVDPRAFDSSPAERAARRAALQMGDGPVVGFVGSLKSWHGTDILVQAFAALRRAEPRAFLLLVGDGPMRADLEREATRLGVESAVRFTGAIDHARVPEMLAAMDIAVAPYRNAQDFYFSPLKIYEYLAAGLPVVASRIGQIAELVDAGLVAGAAPDDAESLAAALAALLADREAAGALAARGRAWVRRHRTWTENARTVAAVAAPLLGM